MNGVTARALLCLKQNNALIGIHGGPERVARPIGFEESGRRNLLGRTLNLDRRLSVCIYAVYGDPTADDAFAADDGGLDLLTGFHDGEHRDHSALGKVDVLNA